MRTRSPRLARVVARLEEDRPSLGILSAVEVIVVVVLVKVVVVLVGGRARVVGGQPVGHGCACGRAGLELGDCGGKGGPGWTSGCFVVGGRRGERRFRAAAVASSSRARDRV